MTLPTAAGGMRFVTLSSPVTANLLCADVVWQVRKRLLGVWKRCCSALPVGLADIGNHQRVKHGFQELTKISV